MWTKMEGKLRDTIHVRFSQYIKKKIDRLVEEGAFKNKSDLVRTATIEFINSIENERRPE
jgi:Arc/MetJ-type ribon-helix-helix transcriptional regulator